MNYRSEKLFSRGLISVIIAQFFSAFADNAILFALLAYLKLESYPDWSMSALQCIFVAAFVISAPFLGPIAEGISKGRVMLYSNGLKLIGALSLFIGLNPFIAYSLVGIGAALYSPAKYGILGELTTSNNLIKANSLIEASVIFAILFGALFGGLIADKNILLSVSLCLVFYVIAMISNLFIPKLPAINPNIKWNTLIFIKNFFHSVVYMFTSKELKLTLIGISLFWGAGMTLRFLLIQWTPIVLNIHDTKTPALLYSFVGFGIILGSLIAGKTIQLKTTFRCIPIGILLGVGVISFIFQSNIYTSYIILFFIGAFGGFFLVPLNALLQELSKKTIGTGNAIAVQNCFENLSMSGMLGVYTLALYVEISIHCIGLIFGSLLSLAIFFLWLSIRKIKLSL